MCNPYIPTAKETYFNISGTLYPKYIPLYLKKSLNFDCLNKDNNSKVILLWTKFFNQTNYGYSVGETPFTATQCPVTNCEITNDKSRLEESDMIIFHMRDTLKPLPRSRFAHQRWVFMLYESTIDAANFSEYNRIFNTSATYKQTSNYTSIYYSDSGLIWEENEKYDINKNFIADKTKFAAAVITNCEFHKIELLQILKRFFPVDLFGKCGKKCPSAYQNGTIAPCKEIISNTYKFYFAFENSLCTDYVSEKFFDILKYDIVPVVYGPGDYDKYVPREAYINALDFETVPNLAKYLLYLDKNSTAYNEYFKWKRYIKFKAHPIFTPFCEMCIQLNMQQFEPMQQSVIEDFGEFWSRKKDCLRVEFATNLDFIKSYCYV